MPLSYEDLSRAAARASRLVALDHTASTNDELVRRVQASPAEWPHLSVVVTDDQRAGRGRLGRVWAAPAGTSLAVSVLLRPMPAFAPDVYGWVPLVAGAAMTAAVRESLDAASRDHVQLKWPNDVLIDGRKVAGVLSELLTVGGAPAVVVGVGVNLGMTEEQLPVPTATSLAVAGARSIDPDAVLHRFLDDLARSLDALSESGGDAVASGVHARVSSLLGTVGRRIRVDMPGGVAHEGRATGLAPDGRLLVRLTPAASSDATAGRAVGQPSGMLAGEAGAEIAVAAGDVTHLRLTDSVSGDDTLG